MGRLPPGSNVGTQLRALRARQARAERAESKRAERTATEQAANGARDDGMASRLPLQLSLPSAESWFAARGWAPFEFQHEVWQQIAAGRSGLVHAATGTGKTYAVWFGLLQSALHKSGSDHDFLSAARDPAAADSRAQAQRGLRMLWITPMRALAADTARSLAAPLAELGIDWRVGIRTGDTDAGERARQSLALPEALVTTPESVSLLLTRPECRALFAGLQLVVVDEWHELIGSKRGVQVQLALARLRQFARARAGSAPGAINVPSTLPVWGLSATLGNLDHALRALLHPDDGVLVQGELDKQIVVDTLLPENPGRFPWGGHLGLQMVAPVVREIAGSASTLVFTNVRSQAEQWYQALLAARPDWAGRIALHHGSLDRDVRAWVELGLKQGKLKAVVATSSLDLGVDFLPVERVLQIGSPKGIARLLQRAGRSGHSPGRASRVTIVPTHALELVEAAAAQKAAAQRRVESRSAPDQPLDVLAQHVVTVALGTGFAAAELLAEVRTTWSYRHLSDEDWRWVLQFAGGGEPLRAYPEYRRVMRVNDGAEIYRGADVQVARRHRLAVGTIVSESAMLVRYQNGAKLGTIEENFIARLRRGDVFTFAGKILELVRVHEMTAFVTPARRATGAVPRWAGTRMPLSGELADAMLAELEDARAGRCASPEMALVAPLLMLQRRWSNLPTRRDLVAEAMSSAEGRHLFVYPFAGRLAHAGLAALLAVRAGRLQAATFSIAINDYGFELLSASEMNWHALLNPRHGLLAEDGLVDDILASLNAGELAQRRFREIARVAGLVFPGYPGQPKSTRQLQASASLLFEVFRKYDRGNLLLAQADREVLEQELDLARLRQTLARMRSQTLVLRSISRPTPFAFPLLVERLREQLTTERLSDRIARMVTELERAAGAEER